MYSTRAFCEKRPEFGHCVSQRRNVIMLWRNVTSWRHIYGNVTSWRHVHGDGCLQTPVVYDYPFNCTYFLFSGSIPTPHPVELIQTLLKDEYRERFGQHHMSDEPKQQTFILGQKGPNIQIVIPTKKTPAEIITEPIPASCAEVSKRSRVNTEITTDKEETKSEKEEKESEDVTESSTKPKKLRSCANCGQVELSPRTFKKCQR